MSILSRIKNWFNGAEGSYRGPALGWSHWGNPFSIPFGDGFQAGLRLSKHDSRYVPAIYACVMATARATSLCWPQHMEVSDGGKRTRKTTSPASRILRKPNDYETWPQFILNLVAQMMFDGEAFAFVVRDDRGAITALHRLPSGSCSPYVEQESGTVFYSIGASPMLASGIAAMAPARDVLHLRRFTPRHPLVGESDIAAASLAAGINVSLSVNQQAFFSQMSRPSGILSTDATLTKDQMLQLRTAFEEQSKGLNAGKIPVLGNGLKFTSLAVNSQDAQLVQAQRMSIEDIARVFGVPLPVIGDLTHATLNNVEATVNFWLSTGLGSVLENVERSFDVLFNLPANEYIEFDVAALLRMDFQARVDGTTRAIQGGLLTPNEGREREGLPPVVGGDQVFLQQQMIPLDLLEELHSAAIAAKVKPAEPADADADEVDEEEEAPEADVESEDAARALTIDLINRIKHEAI